MLILHSGELVHHYDNYKIVITVVCDSVGLKIPSPPKKNCVASLKNLISETLAQNYCEGSWLWWFFAGFLGGWLPHCDIVLMKYLIAIRTKVGVNYSHQPNTFVEFQVTINDDDDFALRADHSRFVLLLFEEKLVRA